MYKKSTWKRLVVLLAGPAQNFILGFALVVVLGLGWPEGGSRLDLGDDGRGKGPRRAHLLDQRPCALQLGRAGGKDHRTIL